MRVPETIIDDANLFIDECESTLHPSTSQLTDLPDSEHIYAQVIKATGKTKSKDEKILLKRASWSPAEHQKCGLPPTGKRVDGEHCTSTKNSTRVRMRSRPTRNYQLQQVPQLPPTRPLSFNERYERLPSPSSNRREPSPSTDPLQQIAKRVSPSFDNSDFISDTSSVTNNTPQRVNPPVDRIYSPTIIRPLLGAYQSNDLDYKFSSSISNSNTVPISSASFTCRTEVSSSSAQRSSLNQYPELTSQTTSIDSSRDDRCHPTTRRLMTMSISPNRLQNQTNPPDEIKSTGDQTDSTIISGGCLKSSKSNRRKKSVHFDCHSPTEIPSVIVTSSSLSLVDNDGQTVEERERTRRTMMNKTTSSLTSHLIHRSFSLSPSPLSREENNSNRGQRHQGKNELNCASTQAVTLNKHNSPTKKSNANENLTSPMPLNALLVKTASFNSPNLPKKSPNAFLNLINRSNSSNNHSKLPTTSRRSREYGHNRLSADVESLTNKDMNKVERTRQPPPDDNKTDLYKNITRSSISMSARAVQFDERDSITNAFLFQPVQSEPFYLSVPKVNEESAMGMMMQTSTLVISTPPQYHYYLYPPSISKKNISMNSLSTNSSSSSSSYDLDDDTCSYSTYSANRLPPVALSDSVQNFWPPPPSPATLNNDPELASTVEQVNSLNRSSNKQSPSNLLENILTSSSCHNDSFSISNAKNQSDVIPPPTSLMLNHKEEEARSYSEQSSLSNGSLRIVSDSSLEDSQTSYSERLRERSRSIKQPVVMNVPRYSLSRSRSKDNLNKPVENLHATNRNTFRPKSAGQVRAPVLLTPVRQEISNDFQSKRQFFENRTYTEHVPLSVNTNRIYTNSPVNQQQRHVTKCSWNDLSSRQLPPPAPQSESTIRTTKYFDSLSNEVALPPAVYRKPVRVVKAVQRSVPSPTVNDSKNSFPIKMNLVYANEVNLSSEYIRNLFPIPDHLKRNRSRQNSETNDSRTIPHDNGRQTDDLLISLKKRVEILTDNQRIVNDEIEINTVLGAKLIKIIESKAEFNEIEKLKLHINEIETITSVLLKLSCRFAKVENDLSTITDNNAHTKANLLEQREKIEQKHDEAKSLKDGIDRRSRLVTIILRKYLSDEQFDDYEHFIRMKSTLLMDAKDIEENLTFLQKQIQTILHSSHLDHLQANYSKPISTTA